MEEIGTVKSVQGPIATVVVPRKSVCDQCTSGTCHLADDGAKLEAINDVGAAVGQKVRVELRGFSYMGGSMIVYGLPALALIVGVVIGKELGPRFSGIDSDLLSAIVGFGAFGLSLVGVKIWASRAEKETKYQPVITEILD